MSVKILLLSAVCLSYVLQATATWSYIESAANAAVQYKTNAAVNLLESQRPNIANLARAAVNSVVDHKKRLIENIVATIINAVFGHKRSLLARLTNSTVDGLIAHKRAIIQGLGSFAAQAIHELIEHKQSLLSNLTSEAVNGVFNHKGILLQEAAQVLTGLLASASGESNSISESAEEQTPYAYVRNYHTASNPGAGSRPNILAHGASSAVDLAASSLQGKVDGLQRILNALVYTERTPVVQVPQRARLYPAPLIEKYNQHFNEDDDYSNNY